MLRAVHTWVLRAVGAPVLQPLAEAALPAPLRPLLVAHALCMLQVVRASVLQSRAPGQELEHVPRPLVAEMAQVHLEMLSW